MAKKAVSGLEPAESCALDGHMWRIDRLCDWRIRNLLRERLIFASRKMAEEMHDLFHGLVGTITDRDEAIMAKRERNAVRLTQMSALDYARETDAVFLGAEREAAKRGMTAQGTPGKPVKVAKLEPA